MLILSYATKDPKYLKFAEKLLKNFERLKINNYYIEYIEPINPDISVKIWNYKINKNLSQKRWAALQKPRIILDYLLKVQEPVLFIDVDSQLKSNPIINNINFDLGIVYRNSSKLPIRSSIHIHNYTENQIRFLESWKFLCENYNLTYFGDHRRLYYLMKLYQEENQHFKKFNNFKIENLTEYFNNIFVEVQSGVK